MTRDIKNSLKRLLKSLPSSPMTTRHTFQPCKTTVWVRNGVLHRHNAPAVIFHDGEEQYWTYGERTYKGEERLWQLEAQAQWHNNQAVRHEQKILEALARNDRTEAERYTALMLKERRNMFNAVRDLNDLEYELVGKHI